MRTCQNCGREIPHGAKYCKGRCQACYQYWRRNQRDITPVEMRAYPNRIGVQSHPPRICDNCGQLRRHQGKGLCHNCYFYHWRTGRSRPIELESKLQKSPNPKRCDCGNLATITLELRFGKNEKIDTFHVCADCAELEQEGQYHA